ncbi:inorganic diphosphatase [Actinoplanes sp. TFC3]|uniref:inorganic diphosphatase n=1 Tax=Actinoplanes sp. TFC3 TaxID=1710355 RepID=UPI000834C42C|nr:inorganic diphosphatase [Actinoplanes sp. TFC3]
MEFDVTVEIPRGTRNKFEVDPVTHRLHLDRTLFTATQYPADYGYIENTISGDGTALDAMVLVQEPTFPGCLVLSRALGLFRMRDEQGPTPKVLCVPAHDQRQAGLRTITDLDPFLLLEIRHFFEVYKTVEPGKLVRIDDQPWVGREEAEAEITRSCV